MFVGHDSPQMFSMFVLQVGGVHSHLISRVQRDKSRVGCILSQNEVMMAVFPMFQQHIEPHLVHAHVSISLSQLFEIIGPFLFIS